MNGFKAWLNDKILVKVQDETEFQPQRTEENRWTGSAKAACSTASVHRGILYAVDMKNLV